MSIRVHFAVARGNFKLKLDLDLPGRGITALFGPSGAGKSTILRLIAGLEQTSGLLEVNGVVWQDSARNVHVPVHRRALGFVFQEASLFAHLSVRRNIEYGMRRVFPYQRRLDPAPIIALLGLGALLDRSPANLSGGERQRVAIARALLASPQLLLMDEPLVALDHDRKQEILPYLERLRDTLDIPMLYVSHVPDEVARLADYLVVLEAGQVVASGPLTEILTSLEIPVRLGEEAGVVLQGKVANRDTEWQLVQIDCADTALWVRDGGQSMGQSVRLRVLARDVSIALVPQRDMSILNLLPVRVVDIGADAHPALVLARLAVGNTLLLARLTRRSAAMLKLKPEMDVWAQIKVAAVIG